MGIRVYINYSGEIDEWVKRHPSFGFLKTSSVPLDLKHRWTRIGSDKHDYCLQIMFIGKTGYGKSTTLNKLVGKNVFETSDVNVCTKNLYTAEYCTNRNVPSFFMISDLPGVGETNYADNHYYKWYKEMFDKSSVVVYVLRADQRDLAVDEQVVKNLFPTSSDKQKLLFAINYADKIEPVNRRMGLSSEQIANLNRRVDDVSRIFNISRNNILYYSAADGINMDLLDRKMAEKLRANFIT